MRYATGSCLHQPEWHYINQNGCNKYDTFEAYLLHYQVCLSILRNFNQTLPSSPPNQITPHHCQLRERERERWPNTMQLKGK